MAQLTEEEDDQTEKIKTSLSEIHPSVFLDYFLVIHLKIWHNISNTLLLHANVLKQPITNKKLKVYSILQIA